METDHETAVTDAELRLTMDLREACRLLAVLEACITIEMHTDGPNVICVTESRWGKKTQQNAAPPEGHSADSRGLEI